LIIGLLAVGLNQSVPKQTDKPHTNQGTGKQIPKQTAMPATQTDNASFVRPSSSEEQNRPNEQAKEATWCEKILSPVVSNWPLIAVAIWGILVASRTLRVLAEQNKETARAARASETQATALTNSERAWLVVEIGPLPEIVPNPNQVEILWLEPHIKNYGKTTATVERISIRQHQIPIKDTLPPEPEYLEETAVNFVLPPQVWARPWQLGIPTSDFYAIKQQTTSLYFYGFVDYRDLGKERRQTRFCFRYVVQSGFSPEATSFYPAMNMPEPYTRCT
jgi:hypothetical protein